MKDTPSRIEARRKKMQAKRLLSDVKRTRKPVIVVSYHRIKRDSLRDRAESLLVLAEQLEKTARIEDLTVRQNPLTKTTKKGEKRIYYRWIASWREGKKIRVAYLGSVNKMSKDQALEKARRLKRQYLDKLDGIPIPKMLLDHWEDRRTIDYSENTSSRGLHVESVEMVSAKTRIFKFDKRLIHDGRRLQLF